MCRTKIILAVSFLLISLASFAGDVRIANLRGSWKFALGFKNEWTKPEFNDNEWEELFVPRNWENQGFYGYDGFACYRKKVLIPETSKDNDIILSLGYIDDCDEVYVNGKLVGFSGTFPPNFSTAYNVERRYTIPPQYINYGKYNVIVVRVYDDGLEGGFINGDVSLNEGPQRAPFEVDLTGMWEFRTGDKPEYKIPQFDDSKWAKVYVPKDWESQGYNYDGFAWYRKTFTAPESLTKERAVIILGKIDDADEVYLNNTYIGLAKNMINTGNTGRFDQLRVFYIDGSLFIPNKPNVIAVRVLDTGGRGGIYEGPTGIMKQKAFVQFWRNKK